MHSFWEELRQRRVYRVALTYVVVASATVQLLGTVLPAFHSPDWIVQLCVAALALGFPIALVLGWTFEIKEGEVRRTPVAETAHGKNRQRITLLVCAGLLAAAGALAGYRLWHPWRVTPMVVQPGSASPPSLNPSDIPEKSVAVVPFSNLSDNTPNAYFTTGVSDEIATDLGKAGGLKVIGRSSAGSYTSAAGQSREIGRALGVAYVLQGSVQREGNAVKIIAYLTSTRTGEQIWSDSYSGVLDDIFAVQSKIAESIAGALQTTLSDPERIAIEEKPTSDSEAHDLYLRANALVSVPLFNTRGTENLNRAVALLDAAVAKDPAYFLAYCRLASVHDQIYLTGTDHSATRLARAQAAVDAAQALRPDAGQTHLALAEHYYCGYHAYDKARHEVELALRSLPKDPLVLQLSGFIYRRQGQWQKSTEELLKALEYDPQNTYILQQLALTYQLQHRYKEAAEALDRALRLLPEDTGLRLGRAELELVANANTKPLHDTVEQIVQADPSAPAGIADEWLYLALCERDFAKADEAVVAMGEQGYSDEGLVFSRLWCRALVARARGDAEAARAGFLAAREGLEKRLDTEVNQAPTLCVLALTDAALGNKEKALHEGLSAAELLSPEKDTIQGALIAKYLAETYTWLGQNDAALQELDKLAKMPGIVTYGELKLSPAWDGLRRDPRFANLVDSLGPLATP